MGIVEDLPSVQQMKSRSVGHDLGPTRYRIYLAVLGPTPTTLDPFAHPEAVPVLVVVAKEDVNLIPAIHAERWLEAPLHQR